MAHVRLRRHMRRSYPLRSMDVVLSARLQAALMMQRNAALQQWMRRMTAVAAAVLVVCTLSATFARSESSSTGIEESELILPAADHATDTPQTAAHLIIHDLSQGQ